MAFISLGRVRIPHRQQTKDASFFEGGVPDLPRPALSAAEEVESLTAYRRARRQGKKEAATSRGLTAMGLYAAALVALAHADRAIESWSSPRIDAEGGGGGGRDGHAEAALPGAPGPVPLSAGLAWIVTPGAPVEAPVGTGAAVLWPVRAGPGSSTPYTEVTTRSDVASVTTVAAAAQPARAEVSVSAPAADAVRAPTQAGAVETAPLVPSEIRLPDAARPQPGAEARPAPREAASTLQPSEAQSQPAPKAAASVEAIPSGPASAAPAAEITRVATVDAAEIKPSVSSQPAAKVEPVPVIATLPEPVALPDLPAAVIEAAAPAVPMHGAKDHVPTSSVELVTGPALKDTPAVAAGPEKVAPVEVTAPGKPDEVVKRAEVAAPGRPVEVVTPVEVAAPAKPAEAVTPARPAEVTPHVKPVDVEVPAKAVDVTGPTKAVDAGTPGGLLPKLGEGLADLLPPGRGKDVAPPGQAAEGTAPDPVLPTTAGGIDGPGRSEAAPGRNGGTGKTEELPVASPATPPGKASRDDDAPGRGDDPRRPERADDDDGGRGPVKQEELADAAPSAPGQSAGRGHGGSLPAGEDAATGPAAHAHAPTAPAAEAAAPATPAEGGAPAAVVTSGPMPATAAATPASSAVAPDTAAVTGTEAPPVVVATPAATEAPAADAAKGGRGHGGKAELPVTPAAAAEEAASPGARDGIGPAKAEPSPDLLAVLDIVRGWDRGPGALKEPGGRKADADDDIPPLMPVLEVDAAVPPLSYDLIL
jgi:hypothetical protein